MGGTGGGKGAPDLTNVTVFGNYGIKVKQFLAKKPFPKFHNVYLQNVVKQIHIARKNRTIESRRRRGVRKEEKTHCERRRPTLAREACFFCCCLWNRRTPSGRKEKIFKDRL